MKRKSFALALALACFTSFAQAKGGRQPFKLYDFSKGVDTYHSPTTLPDGFVQDSLNGLFDDKAPFTKRAGYAVAWSTKSYSFTGLWTYTDASNTSWQIVRSSDQLTANDLAGHIVKISTVSSNNLIGETNAFGNAYFADQTQGVYYWNGSSTTYVGGSPKGSIIAQFHNRLWVIGAAVPNGNQLYGSKYYDGTTWTTGLNDTDPVQYSVGLQDNFDNLTAEYVYLDTLYLFKHYAIYALYGFGQTNASGSQFQISQLTQECGCIDGGSIQTYNGGLKFMSLRGVEDFNGYTCKRISDPIKNKIDPAIQLEGFAQLSWVQSSQSDWQAGTITPASSLSTTFSPPSLVLPASYFSDSSNADFNLGSSSNLTISSNKLQLSINNLGNVNDNSFDGTISNNYVDTGGGSISQQNNKNVGVCNITPEDGTAFLFYSNGGSGISSYPSGQILDGATNVAIATTTFTSGCNTAACGTWTKSTISLPASYLGKRIKVQICTLNPATNTCTGSITTKSSYIAGGDVSFYSRCDGAGLTFTESFDNIMGGSSTIATGNFTSRTFDTLISSPIVVPSASWSVNTSTPYFEVQTSTSSSGSWSKVSSSSGTSINTQEFVRYISSISINSSDYALSTFDGASFVAYTSSGSFKSAIHNFGSINSFGQFSVSETLNDGSIAFSVCSSSNSNMVPSACSNQTANAPISISTGGAGGSSTYAQFYATFTVTATTKTTSLQSVSIGAFSGSNPVPMASTVWDNRYWLSLTTSTNDTANDAVMVLNSRGAWAPFDIHAGGFTQYKGSLYHSDSSATGNIYLDNQAYSDNGSAINVYLNTKNESLGDLASDSYLTAIYPAASNTGSCSMTVQYSVDSSTLTYSLGSPTLNEFQSVSAVRLPFPIDSSHQNFGQSIDFTVGTNDNSCAFQFLGLEGYVHTRPVQ